MKVMWIGFLGWRIEIDCRIWFWMMKNYVGDKLAWGDIKRNNKLGNGARKSRWNSYYCYRSPDILPFSQTFETVDLLFSSKIPAILDLPPEAREDFWDSAGATLALKKTFSFSGNINVNFSGNIRLHILCSKLGWYFYFQAIFNLPIDSAQNPRVGREVSGQVLK